MPDTSTRRLAAILFADIAGYTALMQRDEQEALAKLARFKQCLAAKTAEFQGNIIQYYGDACVVAFDSPVSAVGCAKALQEDFRDDPTVPVRMGLHLGDVVFKENNVFGDAVNIASRIESMGVPGAVLLSQTVRRQVKNHPEFELISLGSFEFKNVDEPLEVFALANEGFAAPKRAEMKGKLKTPATESAGQSMVWKKWAGVAGIALVVFSAWFFWKNTAAGKADADTKFEKSIAVLPFRNESADKEETQYFCNGVMESVLNALSQIGALRVISRQSIERYRGSDKSIADIAKELGVAHLLEGSVQRAGKRVKINAQLIHATTDRHIWAKEFVGEMDDIFALQSDIATAVANAMQAVVSPDLKSRFERVPTNNMEAWNTYLQAQANFGSFGYKHPRYWVENDSAYFKTLSLCDQALALDPALAEAWTLKAEAWWQRNYWREVFNTHFMDSVAVFARKALTLDPHSAMAHAMLGSYFYETGQPRLGIEYLEKALLLNPNQIESRIIAGDIYVSDGENEKAFRSLKIALTLAPNSIWAPQVLNLLSFVYLNVADLNESEDCLNKAVALSNKPVFENYAHLMWVSVLQGNLSKAVMITEELRKIDSVGFLPIGCQAYSYKRDFEKTLTCFNQLNKIAPHLIVPELKHRWAYALWETGKKEEAKSMFKQAEEGLLSYIQQGRNRRLYAYYDLAAIHAFLGNKEQAWQYLRMYNKEERWQIGLPYFIQVDPLFDNLRNDPEFKEMLRRVFAEKAVLRERLRKLEAEERL